MNNMGTFRQFINEHKTSFRLREENMGIGPPPRPGSQHASTEKGSPFDMMKGELGISNLPAGLKGTIPLWNVPENKVKGKLPFKLPAQINGHIVKPEGEGYIVKLHLSEVPPEKRVNYEDGEETPTVHELPVEDAEVFMSQQELFNSMMNVFKSGGGGMPMGGDPMGGGMPGAPMGGAPMGGPPMGGPPMGAPMGGGM